MRSPRLALLLCLPLLSPLPGCGTLLFPDRRGQGTGDVDPNVIVMDAFWLLFYVVPGVVALAVDFSTGAIYLPPGVDRGEGPFFKDAPVGS